MGMNPRCLQLVDALPQFQPRFEMNPAMLTHRNRFSGFRITRQTGRAFAHVETAESPNLDAPIRRQGFAHVLQQHLDGLLDGGGGQVLVALDQAMNEVRTEHAEADTRG